MEAPAFETKCAELAKAGHSKTHAAEVLKIERRKFYMMCAHMPDIEWPGVNASLRDKRGQRRRKQTMGYAP
jgi:hypothetical protein